MAANVTFEPLLAGHGEGLGGARYSFQDYRASDGVAVSLRTERFATAGRASVAFRKKLRGASHVIERGEAPGGEGGNGPSCFTNRGSLPVVMQRSSDSKGWLYTS